MAAFAAGFAAGGRHGDSQAKLQRLAEVAQKETGNQGEAQREIAALRARISGARGPAFAGGIHWRGGKGRTAPSARRSVAIRRRISPRRCRQRRGTRKKPAWFQALEKSITEQPRDPRWGFDAEAQIRAAADKLGSTGTLEDFEMWSDLCRVEIRPTNDAGPGSRISSFLAETAKVLPESTFRPNGSGNILVVFARTSGTFATASGGGG